MSRHQRTEKRPSPTPAANSAGETGRYEDLEVIAARAVLPTGASSPSMDPERHTLRGDEVAIRAYAIWMGRGRPEGTHQDDWFEAERQLRAERGGTPAFEAEQSREANESRQAREASPTNRERMVAIGRGNQQAGRQGS